MDDLAFNDDGIIPSLTLKHHLKKLYPYVEDKTLNQFIALIDINGDSKIEIQELFIFFKELYKEEITYQSTLLKIASIVYSTNETLESFFEIHKVDISRI